VERKVVKKEKSESGSFIAAQIGTQLGVGEMSYFWEAASEWLIEDQKFHPKSEIFVPQKWAEPVWSLGS
jgi:hypothetical protein